MDNNQIINLLMVVLAIMVGILILLCLIFLVLSIKSKKTHTNKKNNKSIKKQQNFEVHKSDTPQQYNKKSIFDFMEFDEVTDNMIIQNKGKRFLMITECQGVNYDLMSGLEKNSVEQGFLQFLNTLRYPIQIYVQTRTVNLENSINTYKERVDEISKEYRNKQMEYNQKLRSGQYSQKELNDDKFEIARQKNLYEYGVDILNNTERMSLNKNILSKHYYVIISYYAEELGNRDYDKEEIKNMAFSELYTRSQSIIGALSMSGIKSKILDSEGLSELLYIAYNRDESEIMDLKRTLNSGYNDLYTTAPDVLSKRMKELDAEAERRAIEKANDFLAQALEETTREIEVREKERNLDDLIDSMAESIINNNAYMIGEEVAERAKENIEKEKKKRKSKKDKEEGGDVNEKTTTSTRSK